MQCPRLVLCVFACSASLLFAQSNPVPFVNQPLVPTAVAPGTTGLTLTVDGTGFVSGAVVHWNTTTLATTFVSHSQLAASVPDSYVASSGTASVTVTNPAPGGGISNAIPFTVTSPMHSLAFDSTTYSVGTSVIRVVAADFDNDGRTDLVVVNQSEPAQQCFAPIQTGSVSVLLGNGDGTFATKWRQELNCTAFTFGTMGLEVTVGDFNGDGKPDLAVMYHSSDNEEYFAAFLGNGDGTFAHSWGVGGYDLLGPVTVGDFDGDGKPDFANPWGAGPGFFAIQAWPGNGDGTFGCCFGGFSGFLLTDSLVAGDFNNDDILDLAVTLGYTSDSGPPINLLLGTGDGTFVAAPSQPSTFVGPPLITGDFNGDDVLDWAFEGGPSSSLTVLLGNGDGTFTEKTSQPADQGFSSLSTSDLNGDGKPDLVFGDATNNTISALLGNGDGTFQSPATYSVGSPFSIAVGDFNGDGRLDLVAASGDSTITVLLNTSDRSVLTTTSLASAPNPANFGQSVTFTATVTPQGTGTPTGMVTFYDGATALGNGTLDGEGHTALAAFSLSTGTHSITASYEGDSSFSTSTSSPLSQIVNQATTSTTLISSANPVFVTQPVTFTATVSGQFGGEATGIGLDPWAETIS